MFEYHISLVQHHEKQNINITIPTKATKKLLTFVTVIKEQLQ